MRSFDWRRVRVQAAWWRRRCRRLLFGLCVPPLCPACGEGAGIPGHLCLACREGLDPILPGTCCPRCTGSVPCFDCAPFRGRLARIEAALWYHGTGGQLVRRAKLDRDPAALGWLARSLGRRLSPADPAWRRHVAIPVPLSRARLRERGFNQAAVLAGHLAERLRVPLLEAALVRGRETLPQGSALVTSRAGNVAGAFAPGRQAGGIEGRPVLLVDDVVTSGATLRECAAVLRRAGATRVVAMVACSARREGRADAAGAGLTPSS